MNEKNIVITEKNGKYQIQNNGISEFALLGILECIVFDMKSTRHKQPVEQVEIVQEQKEEIPERMKEIVQETKTPDLRTRISNALKAIKNLGGEVEDIDQSSSTDEELKIELENLTKQYKRLKNSKAAKK
jgi:uncharacterized protein (UPF0305 family)